MTVTSARLRLVDIDITARATPLFGAAMREGRSDAVRRTRLNVTGPDGLEWTVRRLLLPFAMRPHFGARDDGFVTSGTRGGRGAAARLRRRADSVALPPGCLLFRVLRLLPWTIEARTYPWGRRFPPIVFAYEVRGRDETELCLKDLAAALERGDGAPIVLGAERVR